jgi:hypothetical protein|tara:strand:+ start:474 stop:761 length:288 start_codon:yes stop_codon:yes gene_type:complete
MKNQQKINEEPLLEINVKVDRTINEEYDGRLNWASFNMIDLLDVFMTSLPNESIIADDVARKRALKFKARLKAYIIEKADKSELKNFDWSEWYII